MPAPEWAPLDPARAASLADARRQLHHAAQLATAAGISYLPPRADDSHTNLEWLAPLGALASRTVPAPTPFRLAVRAADLTLLLLDPRGGALDALPLHGRTLRDAAAWAAARAGRLGADAARYTTVRHYEIPPHPVGSGAPFDVGRAGDFEELGRWFGDADLLLRDLAERTPGASEVRCWPHHFDIATLISLGRGRTIGVGMEPGDVYYDEPYLYVNLHPQPSAAAVASLPPPDGGRWHTHEWIGAVLPGSALSANASAQRERMRAVIDGAVAAFRALPTGD